ncbi:hypothetical protein MSAN_00450300 [Mycena sanguinolenta]|uniref:Uncharacterized protein n=1 Tax=Mycena sanguinolenta TaxID=230812 RepID=A0A8H6ZAQ3_9AGAR|nr:hypothetical protein MSAN_00450300 [Mycena sanguinolenta]
MIGFDDPKMRPMVRTIPPVTKRSDRLLIHLTPRPTPTLFFIDYVESPILIPTPSQTQRRQSFLFLGEPTKTSLGFTLRRPRPTSIQSMPLPSQSRRSSFQYHPMNRDKYDRSWALEEEETLSPAWSEDAEELHDPAATIDWRQFHNDLLYEDP